MISRKVCLLGAFAVGKTSLVRRFVHEVFDERYQTTLGVRIDTKVVPIQGGDVKFIIWDLEGADPADGGAELVNSRMLAYLQGHKLPEEARASEPFQALMRNHMNIAEKDLAWALQLARKSGVSLPVGGLVSQQMARLYGVKDDGRR